METLTIPNINNVKGNLTLPTKGPKGETINWYSSHPEVITTTGEVNRPKYGAGNVIVNLTATISVHEKTIRKEFKANVREMPKKENYEAYLFTYFTGEGYENGEQIYFSLSEGNNPLSWLELNEGKPVFTSELGEKGLRDPFIVRSPEGDKFYLIATDLKIYGSGDWEEAQINGSRSIMVWESDDLVSWSRQRMVEISPQEAGNTWAPEIFYDRNCGQYVVFWASKLFGKDKQKKKNNNSYQKIMYAKTRDFYTFTEPEIYMDYGYSIIDTTMIEHEGKIYRFTKDERNNRKSSTNGKFVFQEVGHSIFDSNFKMIQEGVGKNQLSQGEGPIIFKSNNEDLWYLFIDEFGGRGYVPFVTTDLNSGEWTIPKDYNLPSRPRHGSILPITKSESLALKQKYLNNRR